MTHWKLSSWRRIWIPLFYHCHLLAWHSLSLATELFSHQERRFFGADLMTIFFFLCHCSPFYRHFCITLSPAMLLEGPLPHDSMDMTSDSINFVSNSAHSAWEKLVRTVLKADWNMRNAEFTDLSPLPWRVRSDWALLNTKKLSKKNCVPHMKRSFLHYILTQHFSKIKDQNKQWSFGWSSQDKRESNRNYGTCGLLYFQNFFWVQPDCLNLSACSELNDHIKFWNVIRASYEMKQSRERKVMYSGKSAWRSWAFFHSSLKHRF